MWEAAHIPDDGISAMKRFRADVRRTRRNSEYRLVNEGIPKCLVRNGLEIFRELNVV